MVGNRTPVHPAPSARQVHLWRASLDAPAPLAARLASPVSDSERQRAARLRDGTDRSRYIAGRGWLRHLLAGYLGADPAVLEFATDAHGKPRLAHPPAQWLFFNLSHSGAVVVFAIAGHREVGVDVEEIRDDVHVEGVARRFFTARQHQEIAELEPAARGSAFYATWTRNEAYVKGTGRGLAGTGSDLDQAPGWSIRAFDAGPAYAAAVAVEGEGVQIPAAASELTVPADLRPPAAPAPSWGRV